MKGSQNGYRLRSAHGDTIDPRQPLPTDSVEAQETTSVSPTLTYTGKAAAGAISIASVSLKPIIEDLGSRVGSYWGQKQNMVYSAQIDNSPKKGPEWLTAVVETDGSATCSIFDPSKNLEEMFESLTTTVKRFILKVYDKDGSSLYGWVMGVAVASNLYTFDIFNNRLTEGAQNWVGSQADFDSTALDRAEIYLYNSSIAFGTGTAYTEEVECPKEYSKNRALQLKHAETLSNGQYFVDYMRGEFIGPKADNTASETVTYNVWSAIIGTSSGGPTTNVNVDKVGGIAVSVKNDPAAEPPLFVGGEYELLGALTTDAGTAGDKVPFKGSALGVIYTNLINIAGTKEAVLLGGATQAAGDAGVQALVVRNDTLADLSGGDGKYGPLQVDATGSLYVKDANSTNIPNVIGTDGSAGPTMCLSMAGTNSGNIQELEVNASGEVHVVQDVAANLNMTEASAATIAGDTTSIDGKMTACNTGAIVGTVLPTAVTNINTSAAAASLVVKASPGTAYEIRGHNDKASSQYIQVHDASSLPADTAVPEDVIIVPADSNFFISYPQGKVFATGIVVSNSSTMATKTIGSADCWISAEYL